jgi:hypothetical protein
MSTLQEQFLIDLISDLNKTKEQLKEIKAHESYLKQRLLDLHQNNEVNDSFEVTDGPLKYKVDIKQITSQLFDKKQYLEDHGSDALNDYLKQSESMRINLKVKAA